PKKITKIFKLKLRVLRQDGGGKLRISDFLQSNRVIAENDDPFKSLVNVAQNPLSSLWGKSDMVKIINDDHGLITVELVERRKLWVLILVQELVFHQFLEFLTLQRRDLIALDQNWNEAFFVTVAKQDFGE